MKQIEFNGETHFVSDIWEFIDLLPSDIREDVEYLVNSEIEQATDEVWARFP